MGEKPVVHGKIIRPGESDYERLKVLPPGKTIWDDDDYGCSVRHVAVTKDGQIVDFGPAGSSMNVHRSSADGDHYNLDEITLVIDG